jgi:hypothetical protein
LNAQGLKKVAGEVADTFTSEMKGKSETDSTASIIPDTATSKSGQSREQSDRGLGPPAGIGPAAGPGRGPR